MRLLLLIAYPLLAHASVLLRSPRFEWAALTSLAAGCLYAGLSRRQWKTWLAFVAIAALLAALTEAGGGRYALYLPSLVAPLLVLMPFVESLLPGHTPLVSRMASLVHGTLPPVLVAYTRRVTWLWVLAIVLFAGIDIALMAFASREVWSLYANGLAYLLIGGVFIGEYLWRRWRFREMDHMGFADYLRLVARNPPQMADERQRPFQADAAHADAAADSGCGVGDVPSRRWIGQQSWRVCSDGHAIRGLVAVTSLRGESL